MSIHYVRWAAMIKTTNLGHKVHTTEPFKARGAFDKRISSCKKGSSRWRLPVLEQMQPPQAIPHPMMYLMRHENPREKGHEGRPGQIHPRQSPRPFSRIVVILTGHESYHPGSHEWKWLKAKHNETIDGSWFYSRNVKGIVEGWFVQVNPCRWRNPGQFPVQVMRKTLCTICSF